MGFSNVSATLSDPAARWPAVTPNDSADLPGGLCRSLYVGGAGDVTALDEDGNSSVHKAVPAGARLPIRAKRVMATGTTATFILAYY